MYVEAKNMYVEAKITTIFRGGWCHQEERNYGEIYGRELYEVNCFPSNVKQVLVQHFVYVISFILHKRIIIKRFFISLWVFLGLKLAST